MTHKEWSPKANARLAGVFEALERTLESAGCRSGLIRKSDEA
jgi:hypothetical protein